MAIFLLAAYIFLIFVRPMEWWEPVKDWRLVNFAAILTVCVSIPQILGRYRSAWQVPEMRMAVLLLFGATLSLLPWWLGGMPAAFVEFGKVIVLYALVVLLARDTNNIRLLLWTILLCIAWMAVHGITQAWTGTGFGGLGPFMRRQGGDLPPIPQIIAYGIFNDPNDLCLVFICALPLLYAEYRVAHGLLPKIAALLMIPMVLYGAKLTNSRGGFVGLFGMVAAYAIAHTKGFRRWAIVVFGVLLIAVVAPSRFSSGMDVDRGRVDAWGDGIREFQNHPIFGVGYGNFADYSEKVAHNSYIHTLTELGLLGYVPFFLLIFLTLAHVRRTLSLTEKTPSRERSYLSGTFSAMIGYLTACYFLSRQYNPVLYLMLALAIAQVVMICRSQNLHAQVFGPWRNDLKQSLIWCFASIPFFWLTIRVANAVSGG